MICNTIHFRYIVQPCSLHLPAWSSHHSHLGVVPMRRKWNKETFDYLLSFLSSPEAVKMGIFLQSGYNLLIEHSPVSSVLFSTVNCKIRTDLWNFFFFYSQVQRHCLFLKLTKLVISVHTGAQPSSSVFITVECRALFSRKLAVIIGRQ